MGKTVLVIWFGEKTLRPGVDFSHWHSSAPKVFLPITPLHFEHLFPECSEYFSLWTRSGILPFHLSRYGLDLHILRDHPISISARFKECMNDNISQNTLKSPKSTILSPNTDILSLHIFKWDLKYFKRLATASHFASLRGSLRHIVGVQ